MTNTPVLEVCDVAVDYRSRRRTVRAVDGVSFTVAKGQTLGLVGESGSGKSTIGRAILGLVATTEGRIVYEGEDLTHMPISRRRRISDQIQVIFQDPYSSLDITKTIGYTLSEPLRQIRGIDRDTIPTRISEALHQVGLPEEAARRYPAQFSGGQRQRIAIARALIGRPRFVVCDEPVSALDLSIQAEVLNLLVELQKTMGLTLLFISHDLSVVRHISDQLIVLKGGRIVEQNTAEQIYHDPQHPYTQRLLAAAPVPDPRAQAERRQARNQAAASMAASSTTEGN